MSILQDLNAQGITVILVTHDSRIARHAQRVIHVLDGRVQSTEIVSERVNAAEELRALPAEEVAG